MCRCGWHHIKHVISDIKEHENKLANRKIRMYHVSAHDVFLNDVVSYDIRTISLHSYELCEVLTIICIFNVPTFMYAFSYFLIVLNNIDGRPDLVI